MAVNVAHKVDGRSQANAAHQAVMLNEVLYHLAIQPSGVYIDGTYGRGGHASAILSQLGESGKLMLLDKDNEAYQHAQQQHGHDGRVSIFHHSFTAMAELAQQQGVFGSVNGILLDLGVSSPLLDTPERGFSFRYDGALDMRMDTTTGISAAQWLATVKEHELETVLREYGEERYARRIAAAVVAKRQQQAIRSTKQLATIIAEASPTHDRHKHPATRSFQAIRIFINQELEELQSVLMQSLEVLAVGGRLAVISFHSLEDRIVKQFITRFVQGESLPRGLPIQEAQLCKRLHKIEKAIRASDSEVQQNPRARSAVLRVVEKLS